MTSHSSILNPPLPNSSCSKLGHIHNTNHNLNNHTHSIPFPQLTTSSPSIASPRFPCQKIRAAASSAMEADQQQQQQTGSSTVFLVDGGSSESEPMMKLLFVEMGVGYDQHGQDITAAAMRACRDAITSNSIPAFRRGSIPGVTFEQMKLQIKLGVPHSLQQSLDIERVKSVFPYGKIVKVEVVDGGLICSSGVLVEEMGDKNDNCYIVNAAVYVGY